MGVIVKFLFTSLMILLGLSLISGCVSKDVHQLKIDENHHLQQVIKGLEKDYERLANDKKEMAKSNDNLNQRLIEAMERSSMLQEDLGRARDDLKRIEKVLADRSAETGAAMAEMRQEIDRLNEDATVLNQQLEAERVEREARLSEIQGTYDELVGHLESEIERGEVKISELKGKLTVNVVDKILFDSGKAELKSGGSKVLRQIGKTLKSAADRNIQIEGHTDNVPIRGTLTKTYPSNWELSTARATTVLHFLQQEVGVPGERLSAVGYGEYSPIASNATEQGKAQNRRIQIVLTRIR